MKKRDTENTEKARRYTEITNILAHVKNECKGKRVTKR